MFELYLDTTQPATFDEAHRFEGIFGLRALDDPGQPLCDAQQTIQEELLTAGCCLRDGVSEGAAAGLVMAHPVMNWFTRFPLR